MGFLKDLGQTVKDRMSLKTILSEALDTAINRVSHGASELAHGIFTQGTAYVPYGQDAMPVSAPDEPVQASQAEPDAPAAMPSLEEQYQTQVALAAMRGGSVTQQTPEL